MPWQSAANWPAPKHVHLADDSMTADDAFKRLSQGHALLWQGDYVNARQLLGAIKRRAQKRFIIDMSQPLPQRFHRVRQVRAQVAHLVGMLLVRVEPGYQMRLNRAPSIVEACRAAWGLRLEQTAFVTPLTEIIGLLSAHQWQIKGVWISALGAPIYPRWGVFPPTRQEYLDLVQKAPLPEPCHFAADIGCGTGVISAMLAKRGITRIVATDTQDAAIACTTDNVSRLGLGSQIQVIQQSLFPVGQFDLLVCNPPWLPGPVRHPLDCAVYDPNHQMIKGFLAKAKDHLAPGGQAWLILSDLAEHLQLRSRQDLLQWMAEAGLRVLNRLDIRPEHPKASDPNDPLADVRRREITSLWQLSSSA